MARSTPYSALEEYLARSLESEDVVAGALEHLEVQGSPPPDALLSTARQSAQPEDLEEPWPEAPMAPEIKDDGVSRLILILRHLAARGARGMSRSEIVALARYAAKDAHGEETMMQRDLRSLRHAGWEVENVADEGDEGQYVMHRRDLAGLTAGEKSVLQGLLELHAENGLPDPADRDVPESVAQVTKAVDHHSVVSMVYKGHRREVEPVRMHTTAAGWWLRARDEDGTVKWFRLDRMSHVELGEPWSADADIEDPGDSLNPHTWPEDPPVTVRLAVPAEHLHGVVLTFPHARVDDAGEGPALVDVEITNRAAFFGWLVETGTRVRLIGPPEVADEVRSRLREVAGA